MSLVSILWKLDIFKKLKFYNKGVKITDVRFIFFVSLFLYPLLDINNHKNQKNHIRTPCNLNLDLYVFICSKMGVIWKFLRLHHLRTQLWTDFDGTWSNLFRKSTILAPPSRFFQFLPHFFPKRQKICIWI